MNIPELEALVTYLYVVGSRVVGSAPPGATAIPAPKRAPRIRQEDTLFILLVPYGATRAPANIYQILAEQVVALYFKTSGTITSGLRETLAQLNKLVFEQAESLRQPLQISVMCAVMREQEMYIARSGPMVAIYRTEQNITVFPEDRALANLTLAPALGVVSEPRVELSRYELDANNVLILADTAWVEIPTERLQETLLKNEALHDLVTPLRALIDAPLAHAMLIQFVTEDTPTPLPPPVEIPKPAAPESPKLKRGQVPIGETAGKRRGVLSSAANLITTVGEKILPPDPGEGEDRPVPWRANLVFLVGILIPLVCTVVVISLALGQAGTTDFEICRQAVIDARDYALELHPEEGEPANTERTLVAREQWQLVLDEAVECAARKPDDEELRRIGGEAQNHLDFLDRITRREVAVMHEFPDANAELRGPISGNWIQLYTLDRRNHKVYQDFLNPLDGSFVQVSDEPIIVRGQNIRGAVVGNLVDIEWMEFGGVGRRNVPVVLDEGGLLISYSEAADEYDTLQLSLPPDWTYPTAVATYQLNFYVLDAGARQIWRFVPNQGLYSEIPEEYFSGDDRPNLSTAIDFGIDENGAIFVQFNDGSIRKYFIAREDIRFSMSGVPPTALRAGTSLFVDNNPKAYGLWITDTVNETIYSISLGGTFYQGYRPLNQLDAFNSLSGTLNNADLNVMYILNGNRLLMMNP